LSVCRQTSKKGLRMLRSEFVGKFHNWQKDETVFWFRVDGQLGDRFFNDVKFGLSDKMAVVNELHMPLKPGSLLRAVQPLLKVTGDMKAI